MKYVLILLLWGCGQMPVVIGQYTSAADSDPEALAILKKAGQSLQSGNTQVNFSLKISIPEQETITETGVLYQSGKSYHLDLTDYMIISDGKIRWVYLRQANEVNIYDEKSGQDWLNPQDFLQLHTATDLVFVLAGSKPDGVSIIEAKPLKGRFEDFSKFTIQVKNGVLHTIKAFSKDGTRQDMQITSLTHPTTWDAKKLFTFDPARYPGVHIEDLRLD